MVEERTNLTQNEAENQGPKAADIRLRILAMQLSGDYPALEQQYLAKKLKRTRGAISRALSGEIPSLLARIVRHLDFLERRKAKGIAA